MPVPVPVPVTPRSRGQLRRQGDGRDGIEVGERAWTIAPGQGVSLVLMAPGCCFCFCFFSFLFFSLNPGQRGHRIGLQPEPCTQTNYGLVSALCVPRRVVLRCVFGVVCICTCIRAWLVLSYSHQDPSGAYCLGRPGALFGLSWSQAAPGLDDPSNDSVPDLSTG